MRTRSRLSAVLGLGVFVLIVGAFMASTVTARPTTDPAGARPAAAAPAPQEHVSPATVQTKESKENVAPLKFGTHTIVGSALEKSGAAFSANSGSGDTSCPGTDPCP